MNELAAALSARNAATLAWIAESPATRWATTLVTDLSHWASVGVSTVAQLDHYLLVCEVFEASRSAWGYKPSWAGLMASTTDELKRELESCRAELRYQFESALADERAEADAYTAALHSRTGWAIGEIVKL